MQQEEQKKIIKAAKLYYENGLSQDEIAKILEVSRPYISRLLTRAKQLGYVTITINDPSATARKMEQLLMERFNLKDVKIVDTVIDEQIQMKKALAEKAAEYLLSILTPGDILGIAWGTTMQEVVKNIPEHSIKGVDVVQIKGGVTHGIEHTYTFEIITELAKKFEGKAYYLPVPTIVESRFICDALKSDKEIKKIMDIINACNVAIYSIGYPSKESILINSGYFTARKLENMKEQGAAGDICSRFFDLEGGVFDSKLDERTISIELDRLRDKKYAIAVGGGEVLVKGILGALKGGYMNVLITDRIAASKILEITN